MQSKTAKLTRHMLITHWFSIYINVTLKCGDNEIISDMKIGQETTKDII